MVSTKTIVIGILTLAFVLRFYHIAQNPPSVYGDEISFAWNAWSILHTGADEYGISYPLQFRAFGDYKAPIPVYLLVPFFKFMGMNAFSVRLPVVIIATLTVGMTYLLTKQLFILLSSEKKKKIECIALLSALFLAISPWHIHLSRGYFEATLALFPFITGIYFFLKGFEKKLFFPFSFFFFALCLYTYFTPRILLLVFIPFLLFFFRKRLAPFKKELYYSLVFFFILSLPLAKLALFDQGGNRFMWLIEQRMEKAKEEAIREQLVAGGPMIVRKALHNRYGIFVRSIGNDYSEHFSLNFWYSFGDNSLRYFLGNMGMFYYVEFPFIVMGAFFLLQNNPQMAWFLFGWLLLAVIPASLVGRSFAVRSLPMLPVPFVIVSYGIMMAFSKTSFYKRRYWILLAFLLCGYTTGFLGYTLRYHLDYPRYGATWWGWENKTAIEYARNHEDQYDQIFISDFYSGAALAYAFYAQIDPIAFRLARENPIVVADDRHVIKIGKYYFGSLDLDDKRMEMGILPPKTLYIGRPEEPKGQGTILAPDDNRVLFNIHKT